MPLFRTELPPRVIPERALICRISDTSIGTWTSDRLAGRFVIKFTDITVPNKAKKCKVWAITFGGWVSMSNKAYHITAQKPLPIVAWGDGITWNFEVAGEVRTPFIYKLVKTGTVIDSLMRVEVAAPFAVYADDTYPTMVAWTFEMDLFYEWLY